MADRKLQLLLTMKDQMSRQLNQAANKTTKFQNSVKKLGGIMAGVFGIAIIGRFVSESVRLFGIQE